MGMTACKDGGFLPDIKIYKIQAGLKTEIS